MTDSFLTPDAIDAIRTHMNRDHADDNVTICRGVGGQPSVTEAVMTGIDLDGIDFDTTTPDGPVPVRVPFRRRLTERSQVRAEVAELFHLAERVLEEPRAE